MKPVLSLLICLLTWLYALNSQSQELHVAHCLEGCPRGAPASNELIIRHLFAVSVNQQIRLADWVSYRIIPGSIGVASLLPRVWENDDLARNGLLISDFDGEARRVSQPNLENAQDSSYRLNETIINEGDQGRLIPMTSFANTSYWPDLNLLSIMSFMKSDMRLGPWSRLDQAVNELVQRQGEIFVIVGPVYRQNNNSSTLSIEDSGYEPSAFFKVIANTSGEVSVFLFDQALAQHAGYCEQLADLDTIENLSGLELFPLASHWPNGTVNTQLGC